MPDTDQSRLASFKSHTADDCAAFALLTGPARQIKRGGVLRHQGDRSPEVYRLKQGWIACSIATAEGGRQITKIHLPGDLVGMPSLAAAEGAETITALTDASFEVVPLEAFARISKEYPRFSLMLLMWSQEERIRLMHQLTLVGRLRSERRMAAFLLAIYDRVLLNDPESTVSFALPMTQADLADATGMSVVHANRTLKTLQERGLFAVHDGTAKVLDLGAARQLADTPPIPKRDTAWI